MTFSVIFFYSLAALLPPPRHQSVPGLKTSGVCPLTGVLWAPPPIPNRKSRLGKSKLERGCALVKDLRG